MLDLDHPFLGQTRLDYECVGAGIARALPVARLNLSGHDDNERLWAAPHATDRGNKGTTVRAVGEYKVRDDDFGTESAHERLRRGWGCGFAHRIAAVTELLDVHVATVGEAVDDEHSMTAIAVGWHMNILRKAPTRILVPSRRLMTVQRRDGPHAGRSRARRVATSR